MIDKGVLPRPICHEPGNAIDSLLLYFYVKKQVMEDRMLFVTVCGEKQKIEAYEDYKRVRYSWGSSEHKEKETNIEKAAREFNSTYERALKREGSK